MKESFLYSFKITYFKKLLRAGFNHSAAIDKVLATDNSGYGELILSLEDLMLIDSLTEIDNKKMVQDSAMSIGRVAEGAQGKRIFDLALMRYQGKWLDSIARVRSRPFMKNL